MGNDINVVRLRVFAAPRLGVKHRSARVAFCWQPKLQCGGREESVRHQRERRRESAAEEEAAVLQPHHKAIQEVQQSVEATQRVDAEEASVLARQEVRHADVAL